MARILVVDDDPQVAGIVSRILEHGGHEVRVATDGRAAVRIHREEPADLVITDVFMPGQDGIETILQLHAEFPGLKIIVMSGGAQGAHAKPLEDARLLGATRTLAKPFSPDTLISTVQELLAHED